MSPSRRAVLSGLAALAAAPAARAFGDEGAFHPRILLTGSAKWDGPRQRAPAAWSRELRERTNAPSRAVPRTVPAEASSVLAEPFLVWSGAGAIAPLSTREIATLRKFLLIGGVLFVDDREPGSGAFGKDARREVARVLPESGVVALPETHVLYHSFYLVKRPVGRVEGPDKLDAILRAGSASVLFSSHDVLGAIARDASGTHVFDIDSALREQATRLLVNLAMVVLCSNYKDDQVHAEALMKRRGLR